MIVKMEFEDSENALLDEYRKKTLDDDEVDLLYYVCDGP